MYGDNDPQRTTRQAEGCKTDPQTDPPDILAELDRWMTTSQGRRVVAGFIYRPLIQRARDEIVALRELVAEEADRSQEFADSIHDKARAEALEEAALACEARRDATGPQDAYAVLDVASYGSACKGCAHDIRALKEVVR